MLLAEGGVHRMMSLKVHPGPMRCLRLHCELCTAHWQIEPALKPVDPDQGHFNVAL
jgi:hypothetical protein